MLKGFKRFVLRGNVVDLAVAVVIGVAFGALVKSVVDAVISPIVGSIVGDTGFASLSIHLRGDNAIAYGAVIDAIITFLAVAAAVYFFIVAPLNALAARRMQQEAPTTRPCPFRTSEIALSATRCAFCTSEVPPAGDA